LLPPSAISIDAFAGILGITAVALAGAAVAVAARWTRRRCDLLLRRVRDRLAAVRADQGPNTPVRVPHAGGAEAAAVLAELKALAACYRKALAEVVRANEQVEAARAGVGPDGKPIPPPPSFFGSSRHRMVARLTPSLHVLAVTLPLQQFLGGPSADLVARPLLELVHPEEAPFLRRSLQAALKEGEQHDVRFRVVVPPEPGGEGLTQAQERHVQMDVMTCCDETGAPLHLRCHLLDVTERVLTERALLATTREVSQANARLRRSNEDLERLKESYRDLYHFAPVMYFSLDARGNLVAFNETMLRALGYPREALLQQPFAKLLEPAQRAAFVADLSALQRPGEQEMCWVKQDGTVLDMWVGTTTIHDLAGNFVRSRSAARDISDRKLLAGALRHKAEQLGRANAQLRRTNQELEEFTYVFSHDLKEPLRTLEAFSNFLAHDYGPAPGREGQEYIAHLVQASRRLGTLIDDLLTLSCAGRVLKTPRPFDFRQAVEVALSDLRDLIQRRQAVVQVRPGLPLVEGDPERFIQLLSNLISNALKYNKSPTPEVVIGFADSAFYVRDNGEGIDPAYHKQIFRVFRRQHRRDEVEGTGAGLAIAKKVAEAHGGRIWVESQLGRGATNYFTLPPASPGGSAEEASNGAATDDLGRAAISLATV
jgi:PAS domain S-box-containing protein